MDNFIVRASSHLLASLTGLGEGLPIDPKIRLLQAITGHPMVETVRGHKEGFF